MHIAPTVPTHHNAACTVFIIAAWSIMQLRTAHDEGGEAQIEEPSGRDV